MKQLLMFALALLPLIVYLGYVAYTNPGSVKRFFWQAGAVVAVKSTVITNRDATPQVPSSRTLGGAPVCHARGVCTVTNGDSIGSIFRFCEIPSNAVILAVRLTMPDAGTTGIADFGIYKSTRDGGAVVDADLFGSAVVINAPLTKSDITYESGVLTAANGEKKVYEHAALTADPGLRYDVAATLTAAADATAAILLEVDYVV